MTHQALKPLIDECRHESNLDTQINLLYAINEQLPASEKLDLPSFITNDYVQRALDLIEELFSGTEDSG
ncbi:MAG: hypothetical protein ACREBU_25705, partial [Nitrososphaera sp.]